MTPRKIIALFCVPAFFLLAAPRSEAALISNTAALFSGGDPGEGLDLSGNFVYAVNLGEPASTGNLTISDATFIPAGFNATPPSGVSFTAVGGVDLGVGGGSLGASANDLKIINVMNNVIYNNNNLNSTWTFAVNTGQYYKIQLLMTYSGLEHIYNVGVSTTSTTPTTLYTSFNDKTFAGGTIPSDKQVVFTFEVTAPGSTISLFTLRSGGVNSTLPAAITIETPEPASLAALLGIGGMALMTRPGRRNKV